MTNSAMQGSISSTRDDESVRSRVTSTANVRVEFLRCPIETTIQWRAGQSEVSLMWVRGKDTHARAMAGGRQNGRIAPGRVQLWFFPEGIGAEGQLTGKGAYDCAGIFVDPAFLPVAAKQALADPITDFSDAGLARAFDDLVEELTAPDELLPLFTDGWAMQALSYVARASRKPAERVTPSATGLAPWQLRRAKEMIQANLSDHISLQSMAAACRLSISHFARAFKASTGVPPHQWLIGARIETARDLLVSSSTPLVEIAGICGFADQSHFSRVFARATGASPGAWRREHQVCAGSPS